MLEEECFQVPLPMLLTGINDVFNESRQKVFNEDIVEIRKGMHEVLSFVGLPTNVRFLGHGLRAGLPTYMAAHPPPFLA